MIENRLFSDPDSLGSAIDNLFEDVPVPTVLLTERGIGYCQSFSCFRYLKSTYLFRYRGDFICDACKRPGQIVEERGISDREEGQLYGEIRVEYYYCPAKKKYQEIAIVRDENLGLDVGIYTAQIPNIMTSHRALKCAESLLATLNSKINIVDPCIIPRHTETVLDFNQPLKEIQECLRQLETQLKNNPFYVTEGNEKVHQYREVVAQVGEINGS